MCTKSVFKKVSKMFGGGGGDVAMPTPTAAPAQALQEAQTMGSPEENGMTREELKKRNRFKLRLDQNFDAPSSTSPVTLGV